MKTIALAMTLIALPVAAFAAGIDSRTYTCDALHALIQERGYVFISQPAFGDFVVADRSDCPGNAIVQLRSVQTLDAPECVVNYCVGRNGAGGQ
jgi:hypothetical protein